MCYSLSNPNTSLVPLAQRVLHVLQVQSRRIQKDPSATHYLDHQGQMYTSINGGVENLQRLMCSPNQQYLTHLDIRK